MTYYKIQHILLFIILTILSSVYSQPNISRYVFVVPTATSFAYPQSIFIDSPTGNIWVTDFDNHRVLRFDVSTLSRVEGTHNSVIPENIFLAQNYPNPFNPATQISFSVIKTSPVSLTVCNLLGQVVSTLFSDIAIANRVYSVNFDANAHPGGIYLYSLHTTSGYQVKKMCLLK